MVSGPDGDVANVCPLMAGDRAGFFASDLPSSFASRFWAGGFFKGRQLDGGLGLLVFTCAEAALPFQRRE